MTSQVERVSTQVYDGSVNQSSMWLRLKLKTNLKQIVEGTSEGGALEVCFCTPWMLAVCNTRVSVTIGKQQTVGQRNNTEPVMV